MNQVKFENLEYVWATEERWKASSAPTPPRCHQIRGSVRIKHNSRDGGRAPLAAMPTEILYSALGAMTGCQALQQVQAGLKAIYVSGWQVAADATFQQMYPDRAVFGRQAYRAGQKD